MHSSEVITLIVCLTILAIIGLVAYVVLWMFTFDKETHKKRRKQLIQEAIDAAEIEMDAALENNIKLLEAKEKAIDLRIEEIVRVNADLEEEVSFLKKQLQMQEEVAEEITPIEEE